MSEKRKDHKGRILKTGESQRKDGIYQYRYTDCRGKRQCVYSPTLQELRQKEKEIQKQLDAGIDYEAGQITVIELLEKYISLKKGVRYNTQVGYRFVLNLVRKEDFGCRKISTVKVSDAKQWFAKLQKDGRGFSTISSVRGVIKPAFQMACDEDAVRKNPFIFKLTDVVVNDTVEQAVQSAKKLFLAGADAVKLEGGAAQAGNIRAIVEAGIPVVGHIGLLPQKVLEEGGYKIKGKSSAEEEALVRDVEAVAEAGACAVVVEGVTPHAARQVTVHSSIPTLGIGSGSHTCDGDVVVIHDLVGAFPWFIPAFVKPRADVAGTMTAAVKEWMEDCYTEPGSISS